ncbi:hypothetical protein ACIP1T_24005 [Pseudomonas japonica]|uniref:hypothetical protein n=1 Tax=Pseudomonas japonica TaxID=256466 RepID=UPI003808FF80
MKVIPALLNCALLLGASHTVLAQTTESLPTSDNPGGTIILYDTQNNACTLSVPPAGSNKKLQYEFGADESPCRGLNNKIRQIIFGNLPSAVGILATDDPDCRTKDENGKDIDDFWLELRTTSRRTSTDQLQLTLFWTYEPGDIVKPGVRLVGRYVRGENANVLDRMSCMRITTSAAVLTDPAPEVTLVRGEWENVKNESETDFKCQSHQVLSARAHYGDENKDTDYRCVTPMQDGKALQVGTPRKSTGQTENDSRIICPINTVMTGREHKGDENKATHHWCAPVSDYQGQPMNVMPGAWSSAFRESAHNFECPGEQVLIGRSHDGDENKETRYRCATLVGQPEPRH